METTEQPIEEAVEQDTFPLDEAAIDLIAEITQQQAALTASMNGILSYFARQHKLQGKCQLAGNCRELTKAR